jgi:hypothetical protein
VISGPLYVPYRRVDHQESSASWQACLPKGEGKDQLMARARLSFGRRPTGTISIEDRIAIALNRVPAIVPSGAGGWTPPDPRPVMPRSGGVPVDPALLDLWVSTDTGRAGFPLRLVFAREAWSLVEPDRASLHRVLAARPEFSAIRAGRGDVLVRLAPGVTPELARLAGVRAVYEAMVSTLARRR